MGEPYFTDEDVTLHHGDALEVLRGLPDASIDAVVTDPPYGLEFMGKDWDSFRAPTGGAGFEQVGIAGTGFKALPNYRGNPNPTCRTCAGMKRGQDRPGFARCRCEVPDFPNVGLKQSRAFGEWCQQWAVECLRVLKPGGHLLAFGGTRTVHRLACAIEDAGFEIRDGIDWLYGSGFPKSLNIGGGRGTALKPAREPIVVARKPLAGTVVANVDRYGTGVLNVDACRIPAGQDYAEKCASVVGLASNRNGDAYGEWTGIRADSAHDAGRWPTNVLLDESAAAALDTQTGENVSRYFPVFRYEAKADRVERPRAGGVAHPTVKPLALMRWLVQLVAPPGGTVLDPFAGSGTTAEACVLEGLRCITIEREPAYLPLIVQRLSKPLQPALIGDLPTTEGTSDADR